MTGHTGESGGGKSLFAYFMAPELSRAGLPVLYLDRENPKAEIQNVRSYSMLTVLALLLSWLGDVPEAADLRVQVSSRQSKITVDP